MLDIEAKGVFVGIAQKMCPFYTFSKLLNIETFFYIAQCFPDILVLLEIGQKPVTDLIEKIKFLQVCKSSEKNIGSLHLKGRKFFKFMINIGGIFEKSFPFRVFFVAVFSRYYSFH